jgi:uncharacterized cupredoxin-like copper-binding protein
MDLSRIRRVAGTHAAVGMLAMALGACEASSPPRAMTVVGTEMAFEAPDRVAPGHYSVSFRNAGEVPHELAFRDPGGEFVNRISIAGGETRIIEVDLEPGTWELGCYEPGHHEAGMHRPLVVEGD